MTYHGITPLQLEEITKIKTQLKLNQSVPNGPFVSLVNGGLNFGQLDAICLSTTNAGFQDISNYTNNFNTNPSLASTLSIFSSSNADLLGSTGIGSVFLEGVDSNFNLISETINLSGTTTVASTNAWYVINSTLILSSGTNINAVGNITFRTATQILAQIESGYSKAWISQVAVPLGYTYIFDAFRYYSVNGGSAPYDLAKIQIKTSTIPLQDSQLILIPDGHAVSNATNILGPTNSGTLIKLRAKASAQTSQVSAFSGYFKVPNSFIDGLESL